jgi:membrane protease YdiL (CAAX protease family)
MMSRMRFRRWVEMMLVFFVGPGVGAVAFHPRHVLVVLAVLAVGTFILLWRDREFDRRELFNWRGVRNGIGSVLIRYALLMTALSLLILYVDPGEFLKMPRERTQIWILLMIFYPFFSVYPQELVWRTFFHHRYRPILPNRWAMMTASALAFGWMHIVFRNPVAVAMTVAGGALFAFTYERTRSTAAVWIEHGLYGCAMFTLGLGVYFYGGAVPH